jgi:hypothetical protein
VVEILPCPVVPATLGCQVFLRLKHSSVVQLGHFHQSGIHSCVLEKAVNASVVGTRFLLGVFVIAGDFR